MGAVAVWLEWTFGPSDYFEVPIRVDRNDYTLDIGSGVIKAVLSADTFDADQSIRERVHDSILDRMYGIQLLTHRSFELSKPRVTRVRQDGSRDIFVQLEGSTITVSGGTVDLTVTDSNARVLRDTKCERLERRASLAELISQYRASDKLLRALLASYDASTRDPSNELVHLYEIRESLAAFFGGVAQAQDALDLAASQWCRLGALCNNEPVRQGRHRGKTIGALRDASEGELSEARGIARSMIESYLSYKSGYIGGQPTKDLL
jgi:hypothetical protein